MRIILSLVLMFLLMAPTFADTRAPLDDSRKSPPKNIITQSQEEDTMQAVAAVLNPVDTATVIYAARDTSDRDFYGISIQSQVFPEAATIGETTTEMANKNYANDTMITTSDTRQYSQGPGDRLKSGGKLTGQRELMSRNDTNIAQSGNKSFIGPGDICMPGNAGPAQLSRNSNNHRFQLSQGYVDDATQNGIRGPGDICTPGNAGPAHNEITSVSLSNQNVTCRNNVKVIKEVTESFCRGPGDNCSLAA